MLVGILYITTFFLHVKKRNPYKDIQLKSNSNDMAMNLLTLLQSYQARPSTQNNRKGNIVYLSINPLHLTP